MADQPEPDANSASTRRPVIVLVLVALCSGILTGLWIHRACADPGQLRHLASLLAIAPDLFLRLIKLVIAPLVLSTLTVGIAKVGDRAALGRIGLRTLSWFVMASMLSLSLGLTLVNLLKPGVGLNLHVPDTLAATGLHAREFNWHDFIDHLFPESIVDALARNDILQIVTFSVLLGTALGGLGERGTPIIRVLESVTHTMLRVTGYIMRAAPIAVFAAIVRVVALSGGDILGIYAKLIGGFYLGLIALWMVLGATALAFLGSSTYELLLCIREPLLVAFSTASSEAAYPPLLEALDRFGVRRMISGFVLPLGYSFNLDGSMMYMTFGTVFVSQAYNIEMTASVQFAMMLTLFVTSKGMAGVPRASLLVIAAVIPNFGLPEAGVLLLVAVDQILDMGRTATNVFGNALVASVIGRWENAREK